MADIGVNVKVDGESEYRRQMRQIIQESKTLAAEMKAVSAEFDKSTSAQEKAEKTAEVLTKQVEKQKEKVKLLTDRWERASAALGDNNIETLKCEEAVRLNPNRNMPQSWSCSPRRCRISTWRSMNKPGC